MRKPIYLDYHAHALLDPRVAVTLADAFSTLDANPHSNHAPGEAARQAVEIARQQVADLIGCASGEIVFTSGATESNNLAIRGIASLARERAARRILVSAGEHPSVLAAADEAAGGEAERIPLLPTGLINLQALEAMLDPSVFLVSVAAANHEIGTIQPLAAISGLAHSVGALFHSDLAQAAAWIDIDSSLLDLASLSSHKLGGPVGIGALFVRRRLRRFLKPLNLGGGQEHGARSGSVPAPLCVAFGAACAIAAAERVSDSDRVGQLRDGFAARLMNIPDVCINGGEIRLPGNLNISFEGVDGEALALRVRDYISVSTGSACTSTQLEVSHVLKAIGLDDRRAESALRFGLGRATTAGELEFAADIVAAAVQDLRALTRRAA